MVQRSASSCGEEYRVGDHRPVLVRLARPAWKALCHKISQGFKAKEGGPRLGTISRKQLGANDRSPLLVSVVLGKQVDRSSVFHEPGAGDMGPVEKTDQAAQRSIRI